MLITELIYEANDWLIRRYYYKHYIIVEVYDDVGRIRNTYTTYR